MKPKFDQVITVARLTAIVVVLAGLDVAGAIALKEAQVRSSPGLALTGVAIFVSVAAVLYVALDEAELTVVSLAWIILYQVTVMGVDALYYENVPSPVQFAAILVALVALAVAAVAGSAPKKAPPKHAVPAGARMSSPAPAMKLPAQRRPVVRDQVPVNLRLMGLPAPRSSAEGGSGSSPEGRATPQPAPHG